MFQSIALIVLLIRFTHTQNDYCGYSQNVVPGTTYDITSPNYPNNYPAGTRCRWIATCPSGYNCRIDCYDVAIPQTVNCTVDRLVISKTGDTQLISAEYYCGQGSVSVVSTGQTISAGLLSSTNSPGGRLRCALSAQTASSTTCNCGYRRMNRIVGGQETQPNEFTMMAGIIDTAENVIKCGGTIISTKNVVTAAHCIINKALSALNVVVGEHDVRITTDSPATQRFAVASYITHPQFTQSTYDYDIGIVRVAGVIVFSYYVGPVCLPFKYANWDFTGAKVILLGWGTLFPGGPSSKVLRQVEVNVISQSSCQSSVSTVTSRQMCTYASGKDACQDDSGGPVLYTDPTTGAMHLLGMISFGRFCASSAPGVNTRMTALLYWVVQNAPDDYCYK